MMGNRVSRALVLAFLVILVGCTIPMSHKEVNADLYKGETDFLSRAKILKNAQGKTRAEIYKTLGITEKNRNRLQKELPAATNALKHPGALFQPHQWDEMDRFSREMARYSTESTTYQDSLKTIKFMLHKLHVQIDTNGFDHKLFLVFDDSCGVDGCLDGAYLAAVPIHERDKVYIWDLFAGFASSAISQGGKEAVFALGL